MRHEQIVVIQELDPLPLRHAPTDVAVRADTAVLLAHDEAVLQAGAFQHGACNFGAVALRGSRSRTYTQAINAWKSGIRSAGYHSRLEGLLFLVSESLETLREPYTS